jgi:hypothetical protein
MEKILSTKETESRVQRGVGKHEEKEHHKQKQDHHNK